MPPKKPGGANANCSPGEQMTSLLLDEVLSGAIAEQLRAKGFDVVAVVADPALIGPSDDQILAYATYTGRALVTANIKDFMPLDARYRAASQIHAGVILVSTKTFPQDRNFTAAITSALSALLGQPGQIHPGQVLFLPRR
jgi:predicted nuclease of predicted toxin-antitoxin system